MSKYIPAKEVAKIVRGELKAAFPATKFSVVTRDSSAINVGWENGPTVKQVEAITDQYEGATFNSMEDLKEYHSSMYQGEKVHFGADFIFTTRRYTQEVAESVAAQVKKDHGFDVVVTGGSFGYRVEAKSQEHWEDRITNQALSSWTEYPVVVEEVAPVVVEEVAPVVVEEVAPVVVEEVAPVVVEEVAPAVVEEVAPAVVEEVAPAVVVIMATRSHIRASRAFDGTSMSPERREQSTIDGYISYMAEVAQTFQQYATPVNVAEINQALEEYRAGYASRLNAYLSAHSRIFSQFITGAGGWTGQMVRSMQRKNEVCDNRNRELIEWDKKTIERLHKRFDPHALDNAPIKTSDPDAVEQLQEKIDKAKALQDRMRATNATIRKHAKKGQEAQIKALVEMGYSDRLAYKLLQPDSCNRIGYADFELTNNNANIRRMEARIEEIKRLKATPVTEKVTESQAGQIRFVDNTEANRYQLFFPGIPPAQTRQTLKENGFRWTPSQSYWQAFRTWRAGEVVKGILAQEAA